MPLNDDDWSSLVNESEALTRHIDKDVPSLTKSIPHLQREMKKLAQSSAADPQSEPQAQILLAQHGVVLSEQTLHLNNVLKIDLSRSYAPVEPLSDLDLDKHLEDMHQTLLNVAIEESTQLTENSFRNNYVNRLEDDWEKTKRDILEKLGRRTLTPGGDKPQQPSALARIADAGGRGQAFGRSQQSRSNLTAEVQMYADSVVKMNYAALPDAARSSGLAKQLQQAARRIDGGSGDYKHVLDHWDLLRKLVNGGRDEPEEPSARKQHEQGYMSSSSQLRQYLIEGANCYLEDRFKEYIYTIHGNGLERKIENYLSSELNVRVSVWSLIYYCLRCGCVDQAASIAQEAARESPRDGDRMSEVFVKCLQAWKHSRAHPASAFGESWKALDKEYTGLLGRYRDGAVDKYQVVLYMIVGRFRDELQLTNEAAKNIEDYMWIKLHCLWELDERMPSWLVPQDDEMTLSKYRLHYFQRTLRQYGPKHFNKGGDSPLTYFTVLLLSQQFEAAIAYLAQSDLLPAAVHFAILLDHFGLLRRNDHIGAKLLDDTDRGEKVINFVYIIQDYVRLHLVAHPVEAFHYYYLLTGSLEGDRLAQHFITQLIFESKEYDALIGPPPSGADNAPVYAFFVRDDANDIITRSAELAESHGNSVDAIELFQLAQRDDLVVLNLIKQLGRLLPAERNNQERFLLFQKGVEFIRRQRARAQGAQASPYGLQQSLQANVDTLHVLIKLVTFFNFKSLDKNDAALAILDALQLRPGLATNFTQRYLTLDESVKRNMPEIALACMRIFHHQFNQHKPAARSFGAASREDIARRQRMEQVVEEANALVTVLGSIGEQVPEEVYTLQNRLNCDRI